MVHTGRVQERGGARLKALLALLIFAAAVYGGIMIVPPFIDNYQLEDSMKTEAQFAGVNRKTENDIRDDIFRKMQELGIPGSRDDVRVQSAGGVLRISLDYTVSVNLPGYQLSLHFHPQAENHFI